MGPNCFGAYRFRFQFDLEPLLEDTIIRAFAWGYPNLAEKYLSWSARLCFMFLPASILFFQVDVLNIFNGMAKKALTQPAKFFH
jgi:hypothetical protein